MKKIISALAIALCAGVVYAANKLETTQSIQINAPAEKVWALIVDVANWPTDNPAVASAKLVSGDGESIGSVIKFQPVVNGKKVRAKALVAVVAKNKRIKYEVSFPGGSAVMSFDLSYENGVTTLVNYERAEGLILRLIDQAGMDEEHRIWIEAFKRRAEAK